MAAFRRCPIGTIGLLASIVFSELPSAAAASASDTNEKLQRASQLLQAGKPDEAVSIYRELAAAFPAELSFRIDLAIAQYKAHRFHDAIEECNALLKRQPELFPAWLFLGASELELGEAASASVALKKAVDLNPGDRNARLMLADSMLFQERYGEATAQFEEVSSVMPDSPRVLFGLERSYEALSVAVSDRLERTAPSSPEFLVLIGDFEMTRKQFARALQQYRQALDVRPSFPGVHESVALIYEKTGHPDWALLERQKRKQAVLECGSPSPECEFAARHFREMTMTVASLPNEMYWQARAFLHLSQEAHARLLKLPPSRESYEAEARMDESSGQWPEAAAAWKEALKLSPGNARITQKLALASCHNNDCVSALPIVRDALLHDPSSTGLNFVYGVVLLGARDPRRALPYLEAAVRLDGRLLDARAALGEAYLEAGESERAIPELESAIAQDADGSRHYQLARAYRAAGRQEQAATALREYREIVRRVAPEEDTARITPP
jgi:tetratricopeptide (TPR) repeat protein